MIGWNKITVTMGLFCILLITLLLTPNKSKSARKPNCDPREREGSWAIGLYQGDSPFSLAENTTLSPILTCNTSTDISSNFYADPFMVHNGSHWNLFFETKNGGNNRGEIALATSTDLRNWIYDRVVLRLRTHISYPFVFRHENQFYMIPESSREYQVRLYRATNFPHDWTLDSVLIDREPLVDASILLYNSTWFMWAGVRKQRSVMRLYWARDLRGPWLMHPMAKQLPRSMVTARPAGRPIVYQNNIYRFAQEATKKAYGNSVHMLHVSRLSQTDYAEREISAPRPFLAGVGSSSSSTGDLRWNDARMHHIDLHEVDGKFVACVDGDKVRT